MKRVVIVGAGFGGLQAARGLAGKGFEVWLLDRQNYHLFQPLLYQVATASIEQESIAYPVRAIIRHWDGVRFRMTEVTGVDLDARQVLTHDGPLIYDFLVLAAGAATNFFGLEATAGYVFELKSLDDAVALRNHLLSAFERATVTVDEAVRRALLTFVVVGGGATGVEFAGALSELVRHVLAKDYPELPVGEMRIVLIEATDRLLGTYPKSLHRYALRRLERMGVEVRLGVTVKDAMPGTVVLSDGASISAHTLLWAAGVQAVPLAHALPVPRARGGRLVVGPDLTLLDHPEVYVIGDMAHLEQDGKPLPQMAPVAMQQGAYVARHIVRREQGRTMAPFRYAERGTMAVIGRGAAVAQVFGLRLSGFLAWAAWLALHLAYLIDFRNRLVVLLGWAYDYFLFERKVRLITRSGSEGALEAAVPRPESVRSAESLPDATAIPL